MTIVRRYDQSQLAGAQRTPQGFLKAPLSNLTRVGVLKYRTADGKIRRELRHPEDVFAPESLATLALAPLTNEHPDGAVTPENVKKLSIGIVGENISHDDSFVQGDVVVMEESSIKEVEAGDKVELSTGYTCSLEEAPGVYEGEEYDVRQRGIVYNHVCITKLGRAGPEVRLRLDSQDAVQLTKEIEMEKITINGVEYECTPELKKALEAQMAAAQQATQDAATKLAEETKAKDELKAKADEASSQVEVVQAKADELQAKNDSLEEKLKTRMDSNNFAKAVQERVALEKVASHVLKKDSSEFANISDVDLKKQVITAKSKTDLTGKSDVYIAARFDSIAEEATEEIKNVETVQKAFESRFDSRKTDSEAARERQRQRTLNGGKLPTDNK